MLIELCLASKVAIDGLDRYFVPKQMLKLDSASFSTFQNSRQWQDWTVILY